MNDDPPIGGDADSTLLRELADGRPRSRDRLWQALAESPSGPLSDAAFDACLERLVESGAVAVSHVRTMPPRTLYRLR